MKQLSDNSNNRSIERGVFLDFSKVFYTINHNILIAKILIYNFPLNLYHLIKNYLQIGSSSYLKTKLAQIFTLSNLVYSKAQSLDLFILNLYK